MTRRRPGEVRDAIVRVLESQSGGTSVGAISSQVSALIGPVAPSSVRSYLQINTPQLFLRMDRGQYVLNGFEQAATRSAPEPGQAVESWSWRNCRLLRADCEDWLEAQPDRKAHV